jgi:Spy/CpxP family protein refolding chaperone
MNKLIIAIVSTLIMTVAGASFAQDDVAEPEKKKQRQHRQQQRQQRGMQSMPVVEMTMRAIRQLDLDDAQKEGIRSVMEGLKENVRPITMESRANLAQLPDLVKATPYNEEVVAAVAALAEKEGALAADRLMLTSQALSDVHNILTPEQRDELDAMAEQRREKRTNKRQPKNSEG